MSRRVRTGLCLLLFGLISCSGEWREIREDRGGGGPNGGLPFTTIHAQVFKLILQGEIPEAIEYYKLAAGVEQAPRWLLLMQSAFSAANRVAGPCRDVADRISEAFKRLGQEPQIVQISAAPNVRGYLTWQGKLLMSNNNTHIAVLNMGRIYDAFTGPRGLPWSEYQQAVECDGLLRYVPLP